MATIINQVRMVFDLNKCLGCQTCTSACKSMWTDRSQGQGYMYWNNVETQPGKGYPKNWQTLGGGFNGCSNQVLLNSSLPSIDKDYGAAWEYNYDQVLTTGGGNATAGMIVPSPAPSAPNDYSSNWEEDVATGTFPNSYFFYLPRICNHCSNPACVAACTRKAVYKRQEDGIVLVDQGRCRGYRHCVQACPYKKIYWNPVDKVSQKCIFCYPRVEAKRQNETQQQYEARHGGNFCATQCVGRIRYIGYYDPAKGPNDSTFNLTYSANLLVDKWKVALRLHPEFGTQPNTFYIPPLSPGDRIPVDLLANLFGDNCTQTHSDRVARINEIFGTIQTERNKVKAGGTSELVDIMTAYSEADRIQL